uniref:Uncharacterized protein n=1 Tax=Kalmanozyma brasiliensis (strain GHG001) TaxID=1365824 RepID=V5GJD3_KALBG
MDSDPFAVWDDPAPASISTTGTSTTKIAETSSDDQAIKENVRLSLEYEDEDPGWGAPSGSASRANSPEKSRKQPSLSRTPSAIQQVSESEAPEETTTLASQNGADRDAVDQLEEDAPVATIVATQETDPADVSEAEGTQAAVDATHPDPAANDDDMDAFEESRQEQAEHIEDGVSPDEFDQKITIAEAPVAAGKDDDGFDDFDEPAAAQQGASANDDFGDFDDFETGDAQNDADFGDDDFGDDSFDQPADSITPVAPTEPTPAPAPVAARTWAPLDVTSKSNRNDLADSVKSLFPLSAAAEQHLSNVGLRQVEGPSQVLVSGESRQLWIDLKSFPSMQPIDWVRSRTRRDYLISMGVPVNLDEIHSSFASGSGGSRQMPTLKLKWICVEP